MSNDTGIQENRIAGDMMKYTAWFGRIGWMAFGFTLLTFMAYVAVDATKEIPILAVDQATGRIIGEIAWSDRPRSDEEITVDIKRWGLAYLSQNSDTIFEEASIALSAMDASLRDRVLTQWESEDLIKAFGTNYLAYIRDLQQVARVEYTESIALMAGEDGRYSARLIGDIVIDPKVGNQAGVIPFDSTVIFTTVLYSASNTLGLKVLEVIDN